MFRTQRSSSLGMNTKRTHESPMEIVKNQWKKFDATGTNLTTSDLSIPSLIAELKMRKAFCGSLDFSQIELHGVPPTKVCRLEEVSSYVTLDKSKWELTFNEFLSNYDGMILFKAITGFGKSTRIPNYINTQLPDHLLIVVEPYEFIAIEQAMFVKSIEPTKAIYHYPRSANNVFPEFGILYLDITTFLVYLKKYNCELPTQCILQIDESHYDSNEYKALYCLLSAGTVVPDFVYLTSATHQGELKHAERPAGMKITDRPYISQYGKFNEDMVKLARQNGPLDDASLKGKTLIFLPDHVSCEMVKRFLLQFGYQVLIVSERTSSDTLRNVHGFLRAQKGVTKIVLTTDVLESGITLDLDNVIDFSSKVDIKFDPESSTFKREYVGISDAEAMQRRGRVGRKGPGTYSYFSNLRDENYSSKIGLILWLALFGLKLPERDTVNELDVIGSLTDTKAAVLIQSGLHPLVLSDCFDEFGDVYGNLYKTFKSVFNFKSLRRSHVLLDLDEDDWHTITLQNHLGGNKVLKSPCPTYSDDSEVIISILLDASVKGQDFGSEDTYLSKSIPARPTLQALSVDNDSGNFSYSSNELNKFENFNNNHVTKFDRKPKRAMTFNTIKSYTPQVVQQEDDEYSLLDNFNRNFKRSSGSSDENTSRSSTSDRVTALRGLTSSKMLTAEDVKNIVSECLKNQHMMYAPISSVGPRDNTNMADKRDFLSRQKMNIVKIRQISDAQSIMPLGCECMPQEYTSQVKKFVERKLLPGKVAESEISVDDLKIYCVYFCQYYNYLVTKLNTKIARAKFEHNAGEGFFSSFKKFILGEDQKIDKMKRTKELLQDLFSVWERFGLYLVLLKKGDRVIWQDDSKVLFVNEYLVTDNIGAEGYLPSAYGKRTY